MGTIAYTLQADDYIAAAKLEMRLQFRRNWLGSFLVVVSFGGLGIAEVLVADGRNRAQGFGMLVSAPSSTLCLHSAITSWCRLRSARTFVVACRSLYASNGMKRA